MHRGLHTAVSREIQSLELTAVSSGESYGTIRASILIRNLQLKLLDGIAFNGVILLSTALDVRTFAPAGAGNELPYILEIPTLAATAYYHNALPEKPADFNQFLDEARAFASEEYLTALFPGDSLSAPRAQEIAARLNHFTGLSIEYLRQCKLKIDPNRFLKELLRSRGQTLAVHDTRYVGKDPDDAGENVFYDPFLLGTTSPFVTTINSYLIMDLGVKMDVPYKVFTLEANQKWKRPDDSNGAFSGFLNTTANLTEAAAANKDFRVFVASGIYDPATPFYGTEYVFDHSGIAKDRITLRNYAGGHMMYLYQPSLHQMSSDIGKFIRGS